MSDRDRVPNRFFEIERTRDADVLRLVSADGTNRLTRACVLAFAEKILSLTDESRTDDARSLILAGNRTFFSVGADLNEIGSLTGPAAYEFSQMGQTLMNAVSAHSPFVIAAVEGHCMGGGLDLALACHRRIAAPSAVFGHRGAALGLITGWGGTQRLPRLIGKGRALELFVAAERVSAQRALAIGLVDAIAEDPVAEALRWLSLRSAVPS
ncbi:MAG: enoyl-CoA hydratase/isomerase family protein [Terriglobales bacterium]